ncbi:MAG: hydroxymethylglutaryl-CoA reductase (NADPH) [archaeon]
MVISSGLQDKVLVAGLIEKKIKFYEIDNLVSDANDASRIRLNAIEKLTKKKYTTLSKYSIDAKTAKPNIENMIGAVQVPLGFAGPLLVNGDYSKGEFFLPIATTEGALCASINRGCSLINCARGCNVSIIKSGQTRSILLKIDSIKRIRDFFYWLDKNKSDMKNEAQKNSKYLELNSIHRYVVGNNIWLRLSCDTKDAMGMNMVSIAAENLGLYIEANFKGIEFISTSGNACVDKKPSAQTLLEGRGKSVIAQATIPDELIEKYLKTNSERLADLNYRKNILGSALSGSYGFNAHFANIIAAIFLATGQDMAHVVEGSHGFTNIEKCSSALDVSVTIPALQVGTVGGGTNLPSQKECLDMLGVAGPGIVPGENSNKLAEIIAGAVLAGEISLLGALSAGHLVKSHLKHNRCVNK